MISNIGDIFLSAQGLGCSPLFITSAVLSIFNGRKNRQNSKEIAEQDEKFQKELIRQKEQYQDFKEAEERAYRLWLREKQREFIRNEASKKLESDLQKQELQMFFKDWPLQISIKAINEKRKKLSKQGVTASMNIVIGRHYIGPANDALSQSYTQIENYISTSLETLGINQFNVYRFNNSPRVNGGSALANIYAMMNCMPTIVIMPSVIGKNNKFAISVGCWTQDSVFPMQRRIFTLDVDMERINKDATYKDKKIEEIEHAYVTIASVLNDTYCLLEKEKEKQPSYPTYAKDKQLAASYPDFVDFANTEYRSLIQSNKFISDLYGTSTAKEIDCNISNAITRLINLK